MWAARLRRLDWPSYGGTDNPRSITLKACEWWIDAREIVILSKCLPWKRTCADALVGALDEYVSKENQNFGICWVGCIIYRNFRLERKTWLDDATKAGDYNQVHSCAKRNLRNTFKAQGRLALMKVVHATNKPNIFVFNRIQASHYCRIPIISTAYHFKLFSKLLLSVFPQTYSWHHDWFMCLIMNYNEIYYIIFTPKCMEQQHAMKKSHMKWGIR